MSSTYRLPDPSKPFEEQDPLVLFAMAIWGEARGDCLASKMGVAWTIINRVRRGGWYGSGLRGVILKPKQFSCFNHGDPNREKMLEPLKHDSEPVWQGCWNVAAEEGKFLYDETVKSPFPDVVAYFDRSMDKNPPAWAKKMELVRRVGRLRFFREMK